MARVADFVTGSARVIATEPFADSASKHNWKGESSGRDALADVVKRSAVRIRDWVLIESPNLVPVAMRDSSEYTPYLGEGAAAVTGQAFLMTRGGESRRAAGQDIFLDPVTTYLRTFLERLGGDALVGSVVPGDSLFLRARRTTVADADGRFRFANLPPGRYLVSTKVVWEASGSGGLELQGGVIAEVFEVKANEQHEVIVRRPLGAIP